MDGTVLLKNNYVAFKPNYIISNLCSFVKCFCLFLSNFVGLHKCHRGGIWGVIFNMTKKEQLSAENCSLLYICAEFAKRYKMSGHLFFDQKDILCATPTYSILQILTNKRTTRHKRRKSELS